MAWSPFVSIALVTFLIVGRADAASLTLQPLTPVTLTLATGETATVQYQATNQSTSTQSWAMTAIAGVTQITSGIGACAQPFVLAANASCVLDLEITADNVPAGGIHGGPIVCAGGSSLQCSQPTEANALDIDIIATPCQVDNDCSTEHYCHEGQCAPQRAVGDSCTTENACVSGYCIDGVCCATACAGGEHDCQACSVAAGATNDGECASIADTSVCDDGNACSSTDACAAGVCAGASDACHDETSCTSTSTSTYVCGACPEGTHSVDGTGATDCLPCEAETFASTAGVVACTPFTTCGSDEVVASEGTATRDRTCATREVDSDPNDSDSNGDVDEEGASDGASISESGGGCSASPEVAFARSPTTAWLFSIGCALALRRRRCRSSIVSFVHERPKVPG